MVEAAVETRKEVSLDRLEALVRRANELRASLNALVGAIESRYSADPRFGGLVSNVLRAVKPSDLSGEQLVEASSSLEKYVTELERRAKMLTEYAVMLDRLQGELSKLEGEASELAVWSELLKEQAPHLAAEAAKLSLSAQRLILQPPLEDLRKVSSEVELLLKEVRSHNRVCRTAYVNRANELLGAASQLAKAVRRARGRLSLTEASRLLALEEALRGALERLNAAARRPLEAKVHLEVVKAELEAIEREVSSLAERAFEEEGVLAREIERLARGLEGKVVTLSVLLEILAKRTGLPLEVLVRQLITLEKRGVASVQVRLAV